MKNISMETNGSKYLNMIHHFEDELFSVVFYLDKVLGQRQVVNILVLLNKFYPSYTCLMNSPECEGESEEDVKWEDVVTGGNSFTVESYLDFQFNIPVFVQKGTEVEFVYTTEGGMKLTLEKDERFTLLTISLSRLASLPKVAVLSDKAFPPSINPSIPGKSLPLFGDFSKPIILFLSLPPKASS